MVSEGVSETAPDVVPETSPDAVKVIDWLPEIYPGFVQVRVLPEKESPVPPKVVVWTLPFVSAERRVPVMPVNIVDELKVVVATCVMAAVQVTELAAVT
jgi:hypothetical protein